MVGAMALYEDPGKYTDELIENRMNMKDLNAFILDAERARDNAANAGDAGLAAWWNDRLAKAVDERDRRNAH